MIASLFVSGPWYQSLGAQFNYKVECDNPQDCPEWFAGLLHSQGVCSSSLIKPDVIVTNYHCLPDHLTQVGADCHRKIEFIFPKSSQHDELRVACDKVVHLSPPLGKEIIRPDYAFLQLKEPVRRRPLTVSQRGFPDQAKVSIYKMDPQNPKNQAIIRKIECLVVQNSIMNPYFTTDTAPMVLLGDCPVVKGNSGSPIIMSDGEAHGVVSATMEIPLTEALKRKVGANTQLNFAFGSNFSCLSSTELGFGMQKVQDCEIKIDGLVQQKKADALIQKKIESALKDLEKKVNGTSQKDLLAGKPLLLWHATDEKPSADELVKGKLLKVFFKPLCLLPKTTDLKPYEKRLANRQVSIPQEVPEYIVWERLDKYLRYDVHLVEKKRKIPLELNPRTLLQKKNISILFDGQERHLDLCSELARQL